LGVINQVWRRRKGRRRRGPQEEKVENWEEGGEGGKEGEVGRRRRWGSIRHNEKTKEDNNSA